MRHPAKQQLWSKLTDVHLPENVQHFDAGLVRTTRVEKQELRVVAFMRWPSGKPCLAVNMYLLDKGRNWTGDTATREASKLSPLIRYCARLGRHFRDLDDGEITSLSNELCSEVHPDKPTERVRNNNTVRNNLQAVLKFLSWYQDNLYLGASPLIGERKDTPAITCERRKNPHSNRYYWYHRSMPNEVSTDPKLPICQEMIEGIEAQVELLYDDEAYSEPAKRRFGFKRDSDNSEAEALFEAYREYITARRDFMIFMMRHTGLRPDEMAQMPSAENRRSTSAQQPYLVLPTLKRRKLDPPPRKFPITEPAAIDVRVYLDARQEWVDVCHSRQPGYVDPEAMFLSTEPGNFGAAVKKSGLDKDFENLCNRAGYEDQQSCFSMFRHLFCTEQVQHHLQVWQSEHGQVVEKDYRTLLERVREKTGHGDCESLLVYIDYAREMDGVWEPVTKALGRIDASNRLRRELVLLRRELRTGKGDKLAAAQVIDLVTNRLDQIIGDAEQAGLSPQPAI